MKKYKVVFNNAEFYTYQFREVDKTKVSSILNGEYDINDISELEDDDLISYDLTESYICTRYDSIEVFDNDENLISTFDSIEDIQNKYNIDNIYHNMMNNEEYSYDFYCNRGNVFSNDDYVFLTEVGGQTLDKVEYEIELEDNEEFDISKLSFINADLDYICEGIGLDSIYYDEKPIELDYDFYDSIKYNTSESYLLKGYKMDDAFED